MGNTPSSQHHHHHHQQQQQQQHPNQSRIFPSAPPTPTGAHHHQSTHSNNHPILLPPPTNTFVDGGYLFPLSNIYPSSSQDWLHPVVQNLILSRRLAPFYRGLEDWEPDWDKQTINHALQSITFSRINAIKQTQKIERQQSLDLSHPPKNHPSNSITKRFSTRVSGDHPSPPSSSNPSADLSSNPRQLIFEAVLNSQIRANEVDRYLGLTVECPICFLYYPPNINLSRCCQQPICTECFTQIKRADPTPQEIKSEPACCPYCVEVHFGVTYEPPALEKQTDSPSALNPVNTISTPTSVPLSTSTSAPNRSTINLQSAPTSNLLTTNLEVKPTETSSTDTPKMKRRQTTSHTSKEVVTTDSIQPDWQAKLEAVKAAVQRRANRRIIFRQEGDRLIPVGITSSRDPSGSAFLTAFEQEHSSSSSLSRRGLSALMGSTSTNNTHLSSYPTAGSGNNGAIRRSRTENSGYGVDLEELMIMEAMRLSLVEEEERKKKAAEDDERLKNMTMTVNEDQLPGASSSVSRIVSRTDDEVGDDQFSTSPTNLRQDTEMLHSLNFNSNISLELTPTPSPAGRLKQLDSNSTPLNLEESIKSTNPSEVIGIQHGTTPCETPGLIMEQPDLNPTENNDLTSPHTTLQPPSFSNSSCSSSSSSKPNLHLIQQLSSTDDAPHYFLPQKPAPTAVDPLQIQNDLNLDSNFIDPILAPSSSDPHFS